MKQPVMTVIAHLTALALLPATAAAHERAAPSGAIASPAQRSVKASFDIVQTSMHTEGRLAVFRMQVSGKAGGSKPAASGKLAGSSVFSYVWPTTLDPSVVGFDAGTGILAFAVTAHPDFDDTPLFDENGDGDAGNDGNVWHSHWVVLKPDAACGADQLKVVDIPPGARPRLPRTWPGLPLLLDSPGWSPRFSAHQLEVKVPFDDIAVVEQAGFDGVSAALRVNASMHDPLLCVVNVFKVASGNLTLPGKVVRQEAAHEDR